MTMFLGLPPDETAITNSTLQNTLRSAINYWRHKAEAVISGNDGHSIDLISINMMIIKTPWFAKVFSNIGRILALTEK